MLGVRTVKGALLQFYAWINLCCAKWDIIVPFLNCVGRPVALHR